MEYHGVEENRIEQNIIEYHVVEENRVGERKLNKEADNLLRQGLLSILYTVKPSALFCSVDN